ncbi:MAG TPA: ATP synthase F0 subunit B [Bacteriovoracaceae bacterium]|nr:ATP synthase F0 subunit B [Bacteriovoracaceae bacterium]
METVQAIFTQLGVDSSLLPQFIIVIVAFALAQLLFLGKLQEILEVREEKTVKMENAADDTLNKVAEMQREYKAKVEEASREALGIITEKKQEATKKYTNIFKESEKEVNQYIEDSRVEFSKEVEANKGTYLAEAKALADSLVQKILQ